MIAGLVLFATLIAYRLLPVLLGMTLEQPAWLPNFSPMASVCLCGAAFLPRRLAIAVPLVALFGTDLILNSYFGYGIFMWEFFAKTIAFVAVIALGWRLRKNARVGVIFPVMLGGSLFFYLTTNTASWLSNAGYAKTFAGWVQALTTGLPEYAQQWPTWKFYRNTLAADVIFTALFLVCIRTGSKPAPIAAIQPAGAIR